MKRRKDEEIEFDLMYRYSGFHPQNYFPRRSTSKMLVSRNFHGQRLDMDDSDVYCGLGTFLLTA